MKRTVHHRLYELETTVQRQNETLTSQAIDQLLEHLADVELEAMISLEQNTASNPLYQPTEMEIAAKRHYQELVRELDLRGAELQHNWTTYALQLCEVFRAAT